MNQLHSVLNSKKWTTIYIVVVIIFVLTIFSTNFIIDPFGNRNWLIEKEYKPIAHERSEKYNYIFYQNNIDKYDCIILGSSRVMSIIPDNKECYNFGVHVANNPEKLFILQEWLKHAPLKTLYLGNELYTLHSKNRPLYLNKYAFTKGSESNYLSTITFIFSLKTIKNALLHQPQTHFASNGSIRYPREEEEIKTGVFNHTKSHFTKMSIEAIQNDYINNPFSYDENGLKPIQEIKKLCDQHHVQIYPFITPTFYGMQSAMQSDPSILAASVKFREDLTNIFGTVYDFDINASQNFDPKNYYDPVHYRPIIGKLIFERFHKDNGYGVILNNNHISKKINAI
ncbi:MAG: hypothetical protein PHO27_06980 [Sulfuricurvum sp.]|nr:hypothetical protein [Sulfuricurvum sp.]